MTHAPEEDLDPRVARTRDAVLTAVRTLVQRDGVEAVTHQRVAAEAGIGRATVYRHWPDRTHLLLDALAEPDDPQSWTGSGDLRTDLTRELGRLQRILSGSPFVPELAALIGRAEWQPELRELEQQLLAHGTAGLRRSLQQAVDRAELPEDLPLDVALAQLAGPLFYRRMLAHEPIADELIEAVITSFVQAKARG
jgi:AcrR family transcriptional regulator